MIHCSLMFSFSSITFLQMIILLIFHSSLTTTRSTVISVSLILNVDLHLKRMQLLTLALSFLFLFLSIDTLEELSQIERCFQRTNDRFEGVRPEPEPCLPCTSAALRKENERNRGLHVPDQNPTVGSTEVARGKQVNN